MTKRPVTGLAFFAGLFALTVAPSAFAYVDPNSAGALYQFLFPVLVAIGLAWRWVKEMVKEMVKVAWSWLARKVN